MATIIRDNGRGPEIVGTGVTVFDVMDGLRYRLYPSVIGQLFGITEEDVDAAIHYLDEHKADLEPAYAAVRANRSADFPYLQAKVDVIREDYRLSWEARMRQGSGGFPEWTDFEQPFIFDRGRGPEIVGSRITVYDIMDYWKPNWPALAIAWWLRLTVPQVEAAIAYIEAHRTDVERDYQIILDRCARGNPPELQAKLDAVVGTAARFCNELAQHQKSLCRIAYIT